MPSRHVIKVADTEAHLADLDAAADEDYLVILPAAGLMWLATFADRLSWSSTWDLEDATMTLDDIDAIVASVVFRLIETLEAYP